MPSDRSPAEIAGAAQPERSRARGIVNLIFGLAFFVGGMGLIVATRYGSAFGLGRPDLTGGLVLFFSGAVAAWIGIKLMTRSRKLRTVSADEAIAASDLKPFLYLRSFALDEEDGQHTMPIYAGLSAPVNPWESSLAAGFAGAGPLVAIGRPGEKFATTGAARVYVTDDEWQDKVLELAEQAQLVVWVYGATEGLRWEISKLIGKLPPEKLVVAFPFWNLRLKKRQPLWDELVASIGPFFPKPLPEKIGDSLFLEFDADWTPRPVIAKPPPLLVRTAAFTAWNRITQGIRTLLARRGIYRHEFSTGVQVFCGILTLIWIPFVLMILLMLYKAFISPFFEIEFLESIPRLLFS